jgi:microcystin-dependent protein
MPRPEDFDTTRIILKNSSTSTALPGLTTNLNADNQFTGLYKGELAVNTYAENNVISSAGIFIRVGAAATESPGDKLIRIGPAFVTNDLTTTNSPTVPNLESVTLNKTGQLWYRQTDKAFFVHNGTVWQKLTPSLATASTAGLIELATSLEVLEGTAPDKAVTPLSLDQWKTDRQLVSEKEPSFSFYVDGYSGNDAVENDGRDLYRPFKTIERALLEVAKVSYRPNAGDVTDYYATSTVFIGVGDYIVDNRPGSGLATDIGILNNSSRGAIQPLTVGAIVSYDPVTKKLVVSGAMEEELVAGQQIFSSGGGRAIIQEVLEDGYTLKSTKGSWVATQTISVPQHRAYNSVNGGITVPRGCSLVGADPRKTRIRPRYVGDLEAWTADDQCFGTGRTSIFKVTGGVYCNSLTFTDNLNILSSHHLCTCVEFISSDELSNPTSGYYAKIFRGLGNTTTPAMNSGELSIVDQENVIVASTLSATAVDSNNFPVVDSVVGSSPYIFNCSVLSRFGLCGMLVDGAKTSGLRSMVTAQFTNVSQQVDPLAFEEDETYPGGKRYKANWRHFSFKACNNAYTQIVSCFVVGSAIHFNTEAGGEMSITNSCSNFGDLSLVSTGYSSTILPQDTGGTITSFIAPKPIPNTQVEIPVLPFLSTLSTATKLYVDGDLAEERISPYTFVPGENIYIDNGEGTLYSAKLSSNAPLFAQDSNGWYFITQASLNGIYTNRSTLDNFSIFINRVPDERLEDERIYWLKLEGITSDSLRRPAKNFILRFNQLLMGKILPETLFIAKVRDTDLTGTALPLGTYLLALLSGEGKNELLGDLYPSLNVNNPDANSSDSLTYRSMQTLLTALDIPVIEQAGLLVPSESEVTIPVTIRAEFARPSLIRCSQHTWEWQGYMNYSSAIPKFQQKVFTFAQSIERIKVETGGGRVYCSGMDHEGNYILGDRVIDLKTGLETSLSKESSDSKFLKNLTIKERLLMMPNSVLDLRSAKLSIDTRTSFSSPINTTSSTYATTEQPGFMEIATQAEVDTKLDDKRAVTPATLGDTITAVLNALMPLGTIIEQETNVAPTYGVWLPCDNREIDVHLYPEYYAAKGSPTLTSAPSLLAPLGKFRVPNRGGRVAVSVGAGYTLGATGGASTHTLTEEETYPHTHNASHPHNLNEGVGHGHNLLLGGTQLRGYAEGNGTRGDGAELTTIPGGTPTFATASINTTGATIESFVGNTGSFGGGLPHNNMQPYIVHNHFVRVK